MRYSGCQDATGKRLFDGDVIESIRYGTRIRIGLNQETGIFEGNFEPRFHGDRGWGVRDISVLDFNDYIKIKGE